MSELPETVDVCIVGVGACGGFMAKELAEAGFSVVGLDAGPRYNPKVDFENDEAEMLKLLWSGKRVTSGEDPIQPWSGSGVGGGTLGLVRGDAALPRQRFSNGFCRWGRGGLAANL